MNKANCAITLGVLAALSQSAVAQQQCTTLQYTGAPFATITASAGNTLPIVSPVVGTVILSEPLPANAVNLAVVPMSWDFSLENSGLTSANAYCGDAPQCSTFTFSTNAQGNITNWNVQAGWTVPNFSHAQFTFSSDNAGDTVSSLLNNLNGPGSPTEPMTITGLSAQAGAWTCLTSYTASYTAPPPPPPPVDPLAAEVAALTGEVNSLLAERTELETANAALAAEAHALAANLAAVKVANADLVTEAHQLAAELAAANAEIAKLKK
jgi:hypothetical protein